MRLALTLLLVVAAAPAPAGAVPVEIGHQGRFVDEEGVPITGTHVVTVYLYDAPTGGEVVWSEDYNVDLSFGYYSLLLGHDPFNPLHAELLLEYPLFLTVQLDQGPEFEPREALASTPYAILSETARNVDGGYADVGEVRIGGATVIDATGWVGPPIHDGTDFALSNQSCADDQAVRGVGVTGLVTCATIVRGDDPRLSDARWPLPGSGDYIQNRWGSDQAASFSVGGSGRVGGNFQIGGGFLHMAGREALQSTDDWLRLNQAGQYPAGVHTPGNLAPGALNVGGANGWGNPGHGNLWVAGASTFHGAVDLRACRLCLYYADTGGSSGHRTMCVRLGPNEWSGWMGFVGDVNEDDILGMKFLCDGGGSGVWGGWPWL